MYLFDFSWTQSALSTRPSVRLQMITFPKGRDLHWEADDSHQVLNGHEGSQNGPDPQSLAFPSLNQLEEEENGKIRPFQRQTSFITTRAGHVPF